MGTRVASLAIVGDGNVPTVGITTRKPAVGVQTTATVSVGAGAGGAGVGYATAVGGNVGTIRGPTGVGDMTGVAPNTTTTVGPLVCVGIGDAVGAPASVAGVTVGAITTDRPESTATVAVGTIGGIGATGADGPAKPGTVAVASVGATKLSRTPTPVPAIGVAISREVDVAPVALGAEDVAAGRGVAGVADGRTVGAVVGGRVGRTVNVGAGLGVDVRRTTVADASPGTMRSGTAVGRPGEAVASAVVRVVNRCSIGRDSGRPSIALAEAPSETTYSVPGDRSTRGVTTTN